MQLTFLSNLGPLGGLEVVAAGVNFFNLPINSRLHLILCCSLETRNVFTKIKKLPNVCAKKLPNSCHNDQIYC